MNGECKHPNLKADYPGLFCIYCGQKIAELEVDEGQLMLRRGDARRYVAVIQGRKQKVVRSIDDNNQELSIALQFTSGESAELKTHKVLMAFQTPQESLNADDQS
jgi:hypothetical protein